MKPSEVGRTKIVSLSVAFVLLAGCNGAARDAEAASTREPKVQIKGAHRPRPSSRVAHASVSTPEPLRSWEAQRTDEEFVGPFASWTDVKRDFGATGDGKTDDTDAIQRALDSLQVFPRDTGNGHIWFPAGTYRITRMLSCVGRAGIGVIGEHPERVSLVWDGPAGENMLWVNARNSRFGRMTFDGRGKAAGGWALHWHDHKDKGQLPSHRIEVADMVFENLQIGMDGGGRQCWLDSEVSVLRCRFVNCSRFGIGLRHFNSVDWWIWDSEFVDCGVGVSNEPKPHGGSFHVYRSIFRGSKIADASIFHTQFYAMRDNYSVGSNRFFLAKWHGSNGAAFTLTGNTIVDPGQPDAIRLEQCGRALVARNTIVTSGAGPAIRVGLQGKSVASAVVVENRIFGVAEGVDVVGQSFERGNESTLTRPSLPVAPAFVGFLPAKGRKVFEVAARSDGGAIQRAIDAAADHARSNEGSRPVVHLPWGIYKVERTVTVPANVRIQIVGDNHYPDYRGTMLYWAGAPDPEGAVMLRLAAPSKATLRHLGIIGPKPSRRYDDGPLHPDAVRACIVVEGADQEGGRVFAQECNTGAKGIGLLVDGLDSTVVECRSHEGAGFQHGWRREWDDGFVDGGVHFPYPSIKVVGGPRARAGQKTAGVWVYGTDTGRFQVTDGARMLVRDTWYENNSLPFYTQLIGTGQLTVDTMFCANYDHPKLKGCTPTYDLKDFRGRLVIINNQFARPFGKPDEEQLSAFRGNCRGAEVLTLNLCDAESFAPSGTSTPGTTVGDVNLHTGNGAKDLKGNRGKTDAAWVMDMLAHTLDAKPVVLAPTGENTTDVRLFRVFTQHGRIGLHLKR